MRVTNKGGALAFSALIAHARIFALGEAVALEALENLRMFVIGVKLINAETVIAVRKFLAETSRQVPQADHIDLVLRGTGVTDDLMRVEVERFAHVGLGNVAGLH